LPSPGLREPFKHKPYQSPRNPSVAGAASARTCTTANLSA
jgi:hypothetical protein